MQAAVMTAYGPPDVVRVTDMPKPEPKGGEIRVRVRASVVGPSDCAFRKGEPFVVKLLYGLRKPKHPIGGVEFAGEVDAVGAGVTGFAPGDRVFGMSPHTFGAHAEYVCVPVTVPLAHLPPAIGYAEIVAVCDGAATAETFLRATASVGPGQRVLINGASGAVGAYAVQLARHYGAHVTGVCSGANVEMVRALGADAVIDYTQADFTRAEQPYDIIFDAVGKSSFGRCKRALKPGGVYLTTVPSLGIVVRMLATRFGGRKAKFTAAGLRQNSDSFAALRQLAERGVLRPVIDRCYPLAQIVDAYRYVETGRKRGNVVIDVAPRG